MRAGRKLSFPVVSSGAREELLYAGLGSVESAVVCPLTGAAIIAVTQTQMEQAATRFVRRAMLEANCFHSIGMSLLRLRHSTLEDARAASASQRLIVLIGGVVRGDKEYDDFAVGEIGLWDGGNANFSIHDFVGSALADAFSGTLCPKRASTMRSQRNASAKADPTGPTGLKRSV